MNLVMATCFKGPLLDHFALHVCYCYHLGNSYYLSPDIMKARHGILQHRSNVMLGKLVPTNKLLQFSKKMLKINCHHPLGTRNQFLSHLCEMQFLGTLKIAANSCSGHTQVHSEEVLKDLLSNTNNFTTSDKGKLLKKTIFVVHITFFIISIQ